MASSSSSETLKGLINIILNEISLILTRLYTDTISAGPSPSSPSNLSSVTLVGSPADPEKNQKQPDYFKQPETSKQLEIETPKKEPTYKQERQYKSPDHSKKEPPEPPQRRRSEMYKSQEEYPRKDSYDPPEQSKPRLLMKREPDLLPTSPQHFPVSIVVF